MFKQSNSKNIKTNPPYTVPKRPVDGAQQAQ